MSGSLLSGGREQDSIVFTVSFEVTAPYKRPSYSHVLAINHENGGKPEKGRVRKGSCRQENGSNPGVTPKPRRKMRLHSKKDPEVNDQGESGPKPSEQINWEYLP